MNKRVIIATSGLTLLALLTSYYIYKRNGSWSSKDNIEKYVQVPGELRLLGDNIDYNNIHRAFGFSYNEWQGKIEDMLRYLNNNEVGGPVNFKTYPHQTCLKILRISVLNVEAMYNELMKTELDVF